MTDDDRADEAPDPPDDSLSELDLAFADIVAGLVLEPPDDDLDDAPEPPQAAPTGPGTFEELRAWVDVDHGLLDAVDDDEDDEPDDTDGAHYEPPAPPPAPTGDVLARWAWAGAVGAPLAYVVLSLTGFDTTGPLGWGLIAAAAAGFVTLVARMKDGPRDDGTPDDGAVV